MEILKFKTNIGSKEDVSKVAPQLDKLTNISKWDVDTEIEEKVLSISGKDLNPQKVVNAMQEAGFEAEILRVLGIGGEDM